MILLVVLVVLQGILSTCGNKICARTTGSSTVSWWTESEPPGLDSDVRRSADRKPCCHWIDTSLLLLSESERTQDVRHIIRSRNSARGRKQERSAYVSHIEGDLEILAEVGGEFGVERQNVEQIVPVDLVEVAVDQRAHVTGRFPDGRINARILAEYVVFAQDGHHDVVLQDLDAPAGYKIQGGQHVPAMD